MKKYLGVLCILLIGCLALLLGLSMVNDADPIVVGEQWCEAMLEKPNQQWSDAETRSFAKACLYE